MKSKRITTRLIKTLSPCHDRLDNYTKHYATRRFTITQFLALDKITVTDKLWVAFRLMPKKNIALAAADIAESVLHLYESKYPDDKRPRRAIEAARSGDKDAADAASNAAWVAGWAAAYTAAHAAAYAAADAAYAAAHAAAYAAAYAVSAAANAANAAGSKQDAVNLRIVAKYWKRIK